mmetsp:Transcript_89193/g.171690  ORF Transcript_89193/g.171690 Transcript_89193/m.171690 type:complete len:112 (+) Transcript_89193:55-390(+)
MIAAEKVGRTSMLPWSTAMVVEMARGQCQPQREGENVGCESGPQRFRGRWLFSAVVATSTGSEEQVPIAVECCTCSDAVAAVHAGFAVGVLAAVSFTSGGNLCLAGPVSTL